MNIAYYINTNNNYSTLLCFVIQQKSYILVCPGIHKDMSSDESTAKSVSFKTSMKNILAWNKHQENKKNYS